MCTPYKRDGNAVPIPSYPDLGKLCRDLLKTGYNLGQFVVNVKNRACHGLEVSTKGVHTNENKSATGEVGVKADHSYFVVPGLSSTHKWDTNNLLNNEITLQDAFYPGLKISTEVRFDGENATVGTGLKVQQKHKFFTLDGILNSTEDMNILVGGSLVVGLKGLMAAYKFDYDINSGELKANNLGFAYHKKDYRFFIQRDFNRSVFEGFFHHIINREVEIAVQGKTAGDGDEGEAELSVGARYLFSGYGHALRAKVNNKSILGLALELKILAGLQATASTEIDLKNFSEGHQIGFGLDFGVD